MLYIETGSTKPYVNLAYEEYFLRNRKVNDNILMLWRNEPSVIVGRYQNTICEVNDEFTKDNGIHVVRRMTGGGAVYHDLGTLCYSFIIRDVSIENAKFSMFAEPVVKALEKLGIEAEISGRNDLTAGGAKFSGTAMACSGKSLLFHGTILYDTDLSVLEKALKVDAEKIRSKGIKSVRSRVTNISSYMKEKKDIKEFKKIVESLLYDDFGYEEYIPDEEDLRKIKELSESKYRVWDWNYGKNPEFELRNRGRYPGGGIEVYIDIDKSIIKSCRIYGDFLGMDNISDVERALTGSVYDEASIKDVLSDMDMSKYFGTITEDQLLECIMGKSEANK